MLEYEYLFKVLDSSKLPRAYIEQALKGCERFLEVYYKNLMDSNCEKKCVTLPSNDTIRGKKNIVV
jgi:hypothetical protein